MTPWKRCLMVVDLDRGHNLASLVTDAGWTAADWDDEPGHPVCTLRYVTQDKRGPIGPTLLAVEVRYQEDPPSGWNWPRWARLVECTVVLEDEGRVAA